jgi:hypothetical protein
MQQLMPKIDALLADSDALTDSVHLTLYDPDGDDSKGGSSDEGEVSRVKRVDTPNIQFSIYSGGRNLIYGAPARYGGSSDDGDDGSSDDDSDEAALGMYAVKDGTFSPVKTKRSKNRLRNRLSGTLEMAKKVDPDGHNSHLYLPGFRDGRDMRDDDDMRTEAGGGDKRVLSNRSSSDRQHDREHSKARLRGSSITGSSIADSLKSMSLSEAGSYEGGGIEEEKEKELSRSTALLASKQALASALRALPEQAAADGEQVYMTEGDTLWWSGDQVGGGGDYLHKRADEATGVAQHLLKVTVYDDIIGGKKVEADKENTDTVTEAVKIAKAARKCEGLFEHMKVDSTKSADETLPRALYYSTQDHQGNKPYKNELMSLIGPQSTIADALRRVMMEVVEPAKDALDKEGVLVTAVVEIDCSSKCTGKTNLENHNLGMDAPTIVGKTTLFCGSVVMHGGCAPTGDESYRINLTMQGTVKKKRYPSSDLEVSIRHKNILLNWYTKDQAMDNHYDAKLKDSTLNLDTEETGDNDPVYANAFLRKSYLAVQLRDVAKAKAEAEAQAKAELEAQAKAKQTELEAL